MMTPEQRAVASILVKAKRDGLISKPQQCEVCTSTNRLVWHHWSYELEHALNVIPLCVGCHIRIHRGKIPEPRTGRVYDFKNRKPPPRAAPPEFLAIITEARGDATVNDIYFRMIRNGDSVGLTAISRWLRGDNLPTLNNVGAFFTALHMTDDQRTRAIVAAGR